MARQPSNIVNFFPAEQLDNASQNFAAATRNLIIEGFVVLRLINARRRASAECSNSLA